MKFLFYLLILLLPTQLGRHFWPDFSFIQGIRVDYLSPTIYLTDILVFLLFLTWALSELRMKKQSLYLILVFIGIIVAGIYFSSSPLAGLYGLVKLFEFLFLGFYITQIITNQKKLRSVVLLLAVGVIFESLLTILQFINQSSIGGIFWFFGERTFSGQTLGIAQAVINGELILRPYGTFSHPNVLAGFLVVAMILIMSPFDRLRVMVSEVEPSNLKKTFFITSLVMGTAALFLTMSRGAIVLWIIIATIWLVQKKKILALLLLVLMGTIFYFSPLFYRFTNLSLIDESFTRREELVVSAVEMIKNQPLVGVGLDNFLVNLPKFQETKNTILYLQPVHNIYLLIAAETGIIGLGFFLWFIGKTYQKIKRPLFIALVAILILGAFDHYFLTLQQGQLLFALVLGLCWAKIKS